MQGHLLRFGPNHKVKMTFTVLQWGTAQILFS